LFQGYRSKKFIVGLTNVSPAVTAPTPWNYAVCGQWPGKVNNGATVSLQCTCKTWTITCTTPVSLVRYLQCTGDLSAYRYLIVQFPSALSANFCVHNVFIRRMLLRWQLTLIPATGGGEYPLAGFCKNIVESK